jgi:hypothetical protein
MLRHQEGRLCRRRPSPPRAPLRLSRWFALGARWAAAGTATTAQPPLEGASILAREAFLLGFGYALGSGAGAGAAPDAGRRGAGGEASALPRSRRA